MDLSLQVLWKEKGLDGEDCDSWGVNVERTQTIKYIFFELSLGLELIACFVNDPRASHVLAGPPWLKVHARYKQILGLQHV